MQKNLKLRNVGAILAILAIRVSKYEWVARHRKRLIRLDVCEERVLPIAEAFVIILGLDIRAIVFHLRQKEENETKMYGDVLALSEASIGSEDVLADEGGELIEPFQRIGSEPVIASTATWRTREKHEHNLDR